MDSYCISSPILDLNFQKKNCRTVSVEVRKSQHKYVIGPRGTNVNEILADTGVSVEVPPLDAQSETITLRGDADKLGLALTAVYAKVRVFQLLVFPSFSRVYFV